MSDKLKWLPELILLKDYPAHEYIEAIYKVFEKDFECSKPLFGDYQVNLKRHPITKGKSATFWHLISTGDVESERDIDIRRCERIAWLRPIIEKYNPEIKSNEIVWWVEQRKGEERFHLALDDFSYLVVIAKRKDYVLLWTAFCIEREHQRRKYKKKYENYWSIKS